MSKVVELQNLASGPVSREQKASVTYKEVISYNDDGEVVSDVMTRVKSPNGGGFVISYTESMCEFLEKTKQGAVVRIFLYLAHHQQYGHNGVFGYRCSHKFLQQVLNLDRKTVYSALTVLKEQFLVNESKIDGQTEFMVNPRYVTIGSERKARDREWNRRWEEHWKRVNAGK